jgi:hypothetical protein
MTLLGFEGNRGKMMLMGQQKIERGKKKKVHVETGHSRACMIALRTESSRKDRGLGKAEKC